MSDNPTTGPTRLDAPETLNAATAWTIRPPNCRRVLQAHPGGSGDEAPTRAFAGFRTEQRRPAADAAGRGAADRTGRDAAVGFHSGHRHPAGRPGRIRWLSRWPGRRAGASRGFLVPPRAGATHAVSGTVHQHAVASGQTAAIGRLAPVALRAVRPADQSRGEPPGRAVPRLGGPGEPAAAGLLSRRDGVAEGRRRQNHDHRDAGSHLRLHPRRPGDGGGRQSGPRHPEPEGSVGDGGERPPAAARRRKRSSATATSAATPRGGRAGWKCWRRKATRRCRKRSAPTTTRAPWRSWSGSTAWCSPTVGPGCCTRRCHRCWARPMCSSWSARALLTARAAPRRRWIGSTRMATKTWCASVAVINAVRPRTGNVDMQKVLDHFSRRCRAVRLVPFDPHLEEGAEIGLDRLRRYTREALTELAAVVADGFPGDSRPAAWGLAWVLSP